MEQTYRYLSPCYNCRFVPYFLNVMFETDIYDVGKATHLLLPATPLGNPA